jgi:effector-binding domain-containing protein
MRIVERAAQPYRGITRHVTMATLSEVADRVPDVFGWLAERGVERVDAPFFRYHVVDMSGDLEVEVGIPVPPNSAIPASDEDVKAGTLPAGRYVVTTHVGHPDHLVGVTADLLTWAEEQGEQFDRHGDRWAGRLEFYRTDPAEEPDMNKWEVELAFKLKD